MKVSDTEQPTRKEVRARMQARVSRLLLRAIADSGLTQTDLGECMGISHSLVGRKADAEQAVSLSVAELALCPREIVVAVLEPLLRDLGLQVVDKVAPDASPAEHHGLLATLSRVSGELQSVIAVGLADGHLDPYERREIAAGTHALMRAAATIAHAVEDEQ